MIRRMPSRARHRWFGFLLSLVVPGLGQAWSRRASSLIWFAAAIIVLLVPSPWGPLLWFVLAAASAREAMRFLGGRPRVPHHVLVDYTKGRVDLVTSVDVPWARERAWEFVSDVPRFGAIDPFHDEVHLCADGSLILDHCVFGIPVMRVGRILHWHEGRGYAFSDLSVRGPRCGFPHVFFISLETLGPKTTRLQVRVRGKWTARWLPPIAVRAWLRLVAGQHGRLLAASIPVAA